MASIKKKSLRKIKQLYYQKQLSMKEIGDKIGVSWNAVYYFMRHYNLKRRTFSEDNQIRFLKKIPSFQVKQNFSKFDHRLKIIGTMLYWAEGAKASSGKKSIDFVNSDFQMINLFMIFLRKICGIDESKLRVLLYCYSNQNVNNLINFWSNLTKIPKSQFTKPYVRDDFKKDKENKMPYGLVHIRYGDKKLFLLINKWKDDFIREFNRF
ncbi:hypothetical protein HZB04_03795 [Candidatus Wolfebacteria bacterium]|nr:hypothetical protein [Candidatus Wolfebacteria bacterium]